MIKLRINNIHVEVEKGTTVLSAAEKAGFKVPSMCYKEEYSNHPSCMVCVVKDNKSGKLFPSCAITATKGMDIITDNEEVKEKKPMKLDRISC